MKALLRRVLPSAVSGSEPPKDATLAPEVIIVDDSPGVQNVIAEIVRRAGMTFAVAASVADVEALQLEGSVSLLLLDLALERSDAIDVLGHLSDIGFEGSVVLMSGQDAAVLSYVETFGREKGLRMLPFLKKPFRGDTLRSILAERSKDRQCMVDIDLAEMLKEDRLEVWYQPRVELASFGIVGFEALVRLRHPQYGLLRPGRFMGRLSDVEMGLLTAHVLRRTITTWKDLARLGFVLKPSMNVRAHELLSSALIDVLKATAPDDARWSGMVMEITDAKLVNEAEAVREAIVRLQLHKVQLALDDFGAVASGLVRCPELKLSEIGVDHRFVNGCARDPDRLTICKAAVAFASRPRLRLVAEGVESVDDMRIVKSLGFDWAQGILFSAPVPYRDLETLLRRRAPLYGSSSFQGAA